MSSVAICAICFEDARPVLEDLQSISACGHVFHELCLQQWMEYFPAGRDPTCPLCKRSISCPDHDVHRLYFQSAASNSTHLQVSPESSNLRSAVEDLEHVSCPSAFRRLESKLAAASTFVYEQFKELESQVAANLRRAEKAEAATAVANSDLAECKLVLAILLEDLVCDFLERKKVQEECQVMTKAVRSHEISHGDRVSRVVRNLRIVLEHRDDWNLLETRVQGLVDLANMFRAN